MHSSIALPLMPDCDPYKSTQRAVLDLVRTRNVGELELTARTDSLRGLGYAARG
jgi:hypothetical protein